ncbi:MAG TPA: hypothetical protein VFB07_03990 [Vicinamibacterales bacterium]|nr:hypothetical protein [Vicinamibacterales bacterium]
MDTKPSKQDGPLDGSVSGTIGGGGAETGGSTDRPEAPAMPPAHPEDAASGRRAPDALGATRQDRELTVDSPESTED